MKYFLAYFLPMLLFAETYNFKNQMVSLEKTKEGFYKNSNGMEVQIKNNFFIKLNDRTEIKELLEKYNLVLLKEYSNRLFLVKSDIEKLLELIETIDNDNDVFYAYPNLYKKLEKR